MTATELMGGAAVLVGIPEPVPARVALRCLPSGPQDVRVYLTLAEFSQATGGALTPDGRVLLLNAGRERMTEVDLDILDVLEAEGWVEATDTKTMRVTDRGRYWLAKWLKANRITLAV